MQAVNIICIDGKKRYILSTKMKISKFLEGKKSGMNCPFYRMHVANPYTTCSRKLPDLCSLTEFKEDRNAVHPSIYGQWRLKVTGYEGVQIPQPGNSDMFIKAKVSTLF